MDFSYWILCLCIIHTASAGSSWSYHGRTGPKYWPQLFPKECAGSKQSPININKMKTVRDASLGEIRIKKVESQTPEYGIFNNRHTVVMDVDAGDFRLQGLPSDYKVLQLHFHWPSEHRVNSKQYPLELHIVTYDASKYTVKEAIRTPKGLAVLGVLFQLSEQDNPVLEQLTRNFYEIREPNLKLKLPESTDWMGLLPSNTRRYYRYDGSLTTPVCYESVVWTVFLTPQYLSARQLSSFEQFYQSDPKKSTQKITDNFRPVQPINHRTVWRSFFLTEDPDPTKPVSKSGSSWAYSGHTGPDYWAEMQPDRCAGRSQSPINVVSDNAVYKPHLTDFIIIDPSQDTKFTIKNNGHTVQVDLADDSFQIMGGNLPSTYTVAQFHFHWGSFNGQGSEHLIDGYAFPLEMHIVTYDSKKFRNLGAAVKAPQGLAVLGVIFKISEHDNTALEPVIKGISSVLQADNQRVMLKERVSLLSLLPQDTSQYYRYNGSLTTPGCYESVIWTVFKQQQYVSEDQLDAFRSLLSTQFKQDKVYNVTSHQTRSNQVANQQTVQLRTQRQPKLVDNFRPVQALYGREVWKSFQEKKKSIDWTYTGETGTERWAEMFPRRKCNGTRQSPINIVRKEAIYDDNLKKFTIYYESVASGRVSMINNGHTVKVLLKGRHYITGGGLGSIYRAVQFHFHWGSSDDQGSEHTFNGKSYPIEMHVVTYDAGKYASISDAIEQRRGLAALGVNFKITEEDNPILNNLIDKLPMISDPDKQNMVEVGAVTLRYFLPVDLSRYYRYEGSLTTPGCQQSIVWTIFSERLPISRRQLHAFRRVMKLKRYQIPSAAKSGYTIDNNSPNSVDINVQPRANERTYRNTQPNNDTSYLFISNNYRPVQPIYGRKVYKSFSDRCAKIYKVGNSLRCLRIQDLPKVTPNGNAHSEANGLKRPSGEHGGTPGYDGQFGHATEVPGDGGHSSGARCVPNVVFVVALMRVVITHIIY